MLPLIGDRFLAVTPTLVRDLATNGVARFRLERASGDPIAWLDRCAALTSLWHPRLAECLDAGALGPAHRFEAYRVPLPALRPPAREAQASARRSVAAFLRACAVAPGLLETTAGDAHDHCLVLPGALDSNPAAADIHGDEAPWFGMRLLPSATLSALVEQLAGEAAPGLTVVEIEAQPGSGGRILLRHCAREGRRLGWVPVAAESLLWNEGRAPGERAALERTLGGRHLLVLHDRRHPHDLPVDRLAPVLLRLGVRSRLPRLLVSLVLQCRGGGCLRLEPLARDRLLDGLVTNSAALRRRAEGAARTCRGLPGEFVRLLQAPRRVAAVRRRRTPPYVVHEARTPYEAGAPGPFRVAASPPADRLPPRLTRVMADAGALARRGRLAAATRTLRRGQAALRRRGRTGEAARFALESARLLLQAGAADGAARQFAAAIDLATPGDSSNTAVYAAAWLGRLRLDALDPEGSEALLRDACASAQLLDDSHAALWATAQLARTLWWQGRFADARALTRAPPAGCARPSSDTPRHPCQACAASAAPRAGIAWWVEASRAALACGDHAAVTDALGAARACLEADDEAGRAELLVARAWWESATGDADALLVTLRDGLRAARAARDAGRALELRIVALDGLIRAGRHVPARRLATRLRRASSSGVPALLAARLRLALACAASDGSADALRRRLVEQGIGACAPERAGVLADWPTWSASRSPAMVDDVMEVVRVCQEEGDARRALERLTTLLRTRLRAASAVVLVGGRQPATITAPSPARLALTTARRAIDTGLTLSPQPVEGGVEAAAPVRYGGALVGAIACRWPPGDAVDGPRVTALLSTAAAAAAPALETLARTIDPPNLPQVESELLGVSEAMEQVRRAVARAADAPFPVLIAAESGCGKELVARALHRASVRRTRAFCALNCAALPEELLEAELFGHTRGAFTGATIERRGLFEEADGGVLFLDEIGELSPRGQAKLLRVLQEGEVRRLGEAMPRRVDVRVVAATNRVLEREAEEGRFRRDLLYRLDVIRIVVPPLRERIEDVPLLAARFWEKAAARIGSRAVLSDAVLAALARHDWPGNVRELQNVIAALAVQAPRRGAVGAGDLASVLAPRPDDGGLVRLDEARRHFETRFVRAALARAGGHRGRAAAALGLTRQGLSKLLERLGLDHPEPLADPPDAREGVPAP